MTPAGAVTTLAGSGTREFADGVGAAASFSNPYGIAVDATGNLYVADSTNNRVRRVAPTGTVTTVGGSGTATFADGVGTSASFSTPRGIALDSLGNVYVADTDNHRIRRISLVGAVTTLAGSGTKGFADGVGGAALFDTPYGVAVDAGGVLYIADWFNNRIRKLTTVGIGELIVTWEAPKSAGRGPITSYSASASAAGQLTKSCRTAGATTCSILGLTSGTSYSVSVTAATNDGSGAPSAIATAVPN